MKKLILIFIVGLIFLFAYTNFEDSEIKDYYDRSNGEEENIDIEKPNNDKKDSEARIAIIIDDLGYNSHLNQKLLKIEEPLTVAILPFLENTEKAVDNFMDADNFELILHMPLEPVDDRHREEDMIMTYHSREEIKRLFNRAVSEMRGRVVGVNNHKGSKFTSDRKKMREFLEAVKDNNMFFIDSVTIDSSVGFELAKKMEIPATERDLFLDYVDEKPAIRKNLRKAEELALKEGLAVVIGHHKENTLEVLQKELPGMQNRGVELVKVSEIIN